MAQTLAGGDDGDLARFVLQRDRCRSFARSYPRHADDLAAAERAGAARLLTQFALGLARADTVNQAPIRAFQESTDRLRGDYPMFQAIWEEAETAFAARTLAEVKEEWRALPGSEHRLAHATKDRRDFLLGFPHCHAQTQAAWNERAERSQAELVETSAEIPAPAFQLYDATGPWRNFLTTHAPQQAAALTEARLGWVRRAEAAALARLEELPPLPIAGWWRDAGLRDFLALEPGANRAPIHQAEIGWSRRAAKVLQADLRSLTPGDYAGFQKQAGSRRDLAALFPEVTKDLGPEEARWGQATAERDIATAQESLKKDPLLVSQQLKKTALALTACGTQANAQDLLLKARRGAVGLALEQAKIHTRDLIKADRFQAAEQYAAAFLARARPEADSVNLAQPFDQYRASCEFLAELARRAGKADPK